MYYLSQKRGEEKKNKKKKYKKGQPQLYQRIWTAGPRFLPPAYRHCSSQSLTLTKAISEAVPREELSTKQNMSKFQQTSCSNTKTEREMTSAPHGHGHIGHGHFGLTAVPHGASGPSSLSLDFWPCALSSAAFLCSTFSLSSCICLWGPHSEDFKTQLDKRSRSCSWGIIQF